jgi:hypothetical protein
MNNRRKFRKAVKAIVAYKGCTKDQAIGILANDGLVDVHTTYKDGVCEGIFQATKHLREYYGEALIQAGYADPDINDFDN